MVESVVFSPDGKHVLSAGGSAILWNTQTGAELRSFAVQGEYFSKAIFSPDGKTVVTGGRSLILWDVVTGKTIWNMEDVGARCLAFSPDGRRIVTGAAKYDDSMPGGDYLGTEDIRLWDAANGTAIGEFKPSGREGAIQAIAFSPDGKHVLSGTVAMGRACDATIWSGVQGQNNRSFKGHKRGVVSVAFSPNGRYVLTGGEDSTAILWDAATGARIRTLSGHSDWIETVAFSSDGLRMLTGGGHEVIVWDGVTGRRMLTIEEPSGRLRSAVFSPDGQHILTGTEGKAVRLWDAVTGVEVRVFRGSGRVVESVSWSSDGKYILTGLGQSAMLWDAVRGVPARSFPTFAKLDYSSGVMFSPDNKSILTAGDSASTLYDLATGTVRLSKLPWYNDVAFSQDGKRILTADANVAVLSDATTGTAIRQFEHMLDVFSVAFSPDGKFALTGDGYGWPYPKGTATLWNLTTGTMVREWKHAHVVWSVEFSPDGKHVLTGCSDGVVRLWDVATGATIREYQGHSWAVTFVGFSPDGKYLLSASQDKIVLRDRSTGDQVKTFPGLAAVGNNLNMIAISADSRHIAAASDRQSASVYSIQTGELLCRIFTLNEDDWAVVTPDGRFDASQGGMKSLYYVQGMDVLPLESFFDQFYTPNLMARVLSGETVERTTTVDFSNTVKLPPLVKITSPTEGQSVTTETLDIAVEATDQGGGIDEIRLFQNGKLVSEEQRGMKKMAAAGARLSKAYQVVLVPGMNEFRATAFNNDRTEANPYVMTVELKAAQASANMHILAIGLNEYQNPKYKLNYGKADAEAFVQAVENRSKGIFMTIKKQVIHDQQAVRSTIEKAFETVVAEAQPQDAFVFFYAGHGVMSEGDASNPAEFYLVPHDVTQLYGNDEMLNQKAVSAKLLKSWCAKIKAQKQLVVLDACQSGGAVETFAMRGASEEKAILQLARSAGVVVMASTGTEQFATEFAQLGHGAFTYALLKGLDGEADGSPKDGKITVKELEAYLGDRLPEITKQYRGTAQYPNSYARGQDFPIGVK